MLVRQAKKNILKVVLTADKKTYKRTFINIFRIVKSRFRTK